MGVELPEELIVRIFERLPIKPLIRFTSLSQRWRFIILYDPQFAKSHFQIASQNHTLTRRLVFKNPLTRNLDFLSTHVPESKSLEFEDHSCAIRKLGCPSVLSGDFWDRMCSCNGIVCLVFHESLYLWNPSTGFCRKLPPLEGGKVSCYGLGYVSFTDDYKLFVIILVRYQKLVGFDREYYTLSLKGNIWKKIEAPPNLFLATESALSNESLHWLVNSSKDVAAFDLAKEEFRTIPLPISIGPVELYGTGGFKGLGASLGGRLCLLDYNRNGFADLWVLIEYGVTDSWAKQFTFKISMRPCKLHLVMETSMLLEGMKAGTRHFKLIRSGQEDDEELNLSMGSINHFGVVEYQETLLWLP